MVEMNALLQQLSPAPLEKVGLVQTLRDQCEALGYRTGAQVTAEFGALPPNDRLPMGAQESVFRIVVGVRLSPGWTSQSKSEIMIARWCDEIPRRHVGHDPRP
jgi:hypothetical protein